MIINFSLFQVIVKKSVIIVKATGRSMRAKSETPFKIGAKEFGGSQMKTNVVS